VSDTPQRVYESVTVRTFYVLLLGMVFLGMAITIPGVAWPAVAEDLGRPIAQLGFVSLAYGAGYTIATLLSGSLARRYRSGTILLASASLGAAVLGFVAISPGWWSFLVGMFVLGLVGGSTDGTANTWVAIRRGAGSMGLLHASFGVGAIVGPLLVAGLIGAGVSWRIAFAVLGIGQLLWAASIFVWGRHADVPAQASPRGDGGLGFSAPLFWSLAVFFTYAGVGGGAAIWAFTYLTEYKEYGAGVGGIIVAAYWGGFTASRFVLGWIGDRIDPGRILRMSTIATVFWLAVFWLSPTPAVAVGALILAGFSHGPVFPLEILLTPRRFGTSHTANVVGFEIAAANIGGAVLPAFIGVLVARWDLGVVPPALSVFSLALLACVELLRRSSASSTAAPDGKG
jgi:fucose permease